MNIRERIALLTPTDPDRLAGKIEDTLADVCAEMDADGMEASPRTEVCAAPTRRLGCFGCMYELYMEDHVAYFAILDAAGTCQEVRARSDRHLPSWSLQ